MKMRKLLLPVGLVMLLLGSICSYGFRMNIIMNIAGTVLVLAGGTIIIFMLMNHIILRKK